MMSTMKKNLFLFAAAVLFTAVSCQEEIASPEIESNAGSALSITASVGADTKTSLGEDGVSSYWAEGDMISVFDSNKGANNRCFEIEEGTEFPAKTATFTYDGEFVMPQNNQPDPLVVALYPYQEAAYCDFFYYDRNYITGLNIPVEQQAVAGAFDSDATFALATGRQSTKEELLFNNLYSLLKVSLVEEGIKKITVTLAEGEYLAGEAKVQLAVDPNDGDPVFTGGVLSASGSNSVSLVCEDGFEVGKNYYIAIAPVTYTSISVALDDKVVKTSTNGKTLVANNIYNIMGLDDPATIADGVYLNESGVYEISNEAGLFWLAEQVAGGETFDGKTVMLTDDIEMTQAWTPIGNTIDGVTKSFRGTFDGDDHTIRNLNVEAAVGAGFFGAKWDGDIFDVKFDNATVVGNHYGGVVLGWGDGANYNYKYTISGCEVTNSTVTLTAEETAEGYDNGDKAGAIVGYAYAIIVSENTVSNTAIKAYRDLGGIVGYANENSNTHAEYAEVINNVIGENVTVEVDNTHNYKNYTFADSYDADSYCGEKTITCVVSGNTGKAEIITPTFLYLKPNSNWTQSNARFAAYFFGNGETWVSMTDLDSDGIYEVEVPDGYPSVIFCRMNPGTTENNWDNKWNQTSDLTLPTDDKLCFVVKKGAWDKNATDEWMTYADAESYVEPEDPVLPESVVLYLKPNSNWTQGNARFAAYFFGNGETWVSMTDSDSDGIYEVEAPAGYPSVIFCRMNPDKTANIWDNKWDQTEDLTIPTDGMNLYTVKDGTWSNGGGTWSSK